jgi:hypothetical protein
MSAFIVDFLATRVLSCVHWDGRRRQLAFMSSLRIVTVIK